MGDFSYITRFFTTTGQLQYLANQTNKNVSSAESFKQKFHLTSGVQPPDWFNQLIKSHFELKSLTNDLIRDGRRELIPVEVFATLDKSQNLVNELAHRVADLQIVNEIFESCPSEFADPVKLLTLIDSRAIPSHASTREWEINFALLSSAYESASSEQTKQTIRFLIINYLAKSAFLNAMPRAELPFEEQDNYRDLMQLGQLSASLAQQYHRTVQQNEPTSLFEQIQIKCKIAAGEWFEDQGNLFCLDTDQIDELYRLCFYVLPPLNSPDAFKAIGQYVQVNIDRLKSEGNRSCHIPCLIDISEQIGSLITSEEAQQEDQFKENYTEIHTQVIKLIEKVATETIKQNPELCGQEARIKDFIQLNLCIVSKSKWNDQLSFLAHYSRFFSKDDFSKDPNASRWDLPMDYKQRQNDLFPKMQKWIGQTGISPGAVAYRQILANFAEGPDQMITEYRGGQPVKWAPLGRKDSQYFPTPKALTSLNLFKNLEEFSLSPDGEERPMQGQKLIAKVTADMCRSLFSAIPETIWLETQKDPAIQEIVQFSTFRLSEHLATAYHNRHDFRVFSHAIDCAHSELATLLTLFPVFNAPGSFEAHYAEQLKEFLSPLPNGVHLTAGLAKSAMNVFAGINAALLASKPAAIRVTDPHSYYEELELVGETLTLEGAKSTNKLGAIDLYVGEFYHNIDIDINHTHYKKGNVIEDIRCILEAKSSEDSLTVAIDATIDLTLSKNIDNLLKTFSKEIQEGRLNLIIFRSGQKFDMLGLDHYFGAPYYIVNNGDEKWKGYEEMLRSAPFQTDPLSQQYFCLMAQQSIKDMDSYKQRIFDNTKKILKLVPQALKPSPDNDVCICAVDPDVQTPFIDIRFGPKDETNDFLLLSKAEGIFVRIFTQNGKIAYRRGSFGFMHANITPIEPKIRINPGIDPEEIALYKQFFDELEALVKTSQ